MRTPPEDRPSDQRDPGVDHTDPAPEDRPAEPSEDELRREAAMADPREPEGKAPEGRHAGARDRPQKQP